MTEPFPTCCEQQSSIDVIFRLLGTDSRTNIDTILSKAIDLLGGSCSIYNRLDSTSGSLVVWAGSHLPPDLPQEDTPEGHICYEATIKGTGGAIAIPNLEGTVYEQSDPNVKRFGLKSYLGHPVFFKGKTIGALAIVDSIPRTFSEEDLTCIASLAAAISVEEERQDKERLLRKSEQRFKSLSEASFEAVFFSENGICTDQNAMAETMFGYTLEEAVGRHGSEWIAPMDRDLVRQNITGGKETPYRVTCLRKDGTTFPAEIQARMVPDSNTRITALRDISATIRMEKELRQSQERYRFITEQICDIVLISNEAGDYTYISPSHRTILGRGDEVLGTSIFQHIHPEDLPQVMEAFARGLETSSPVAVEYRYQHPEKGNIWLESIGRKLLSEPGSISGLITSRDITERKLAEEEIRRAKDRFEAMAELLPCAIVEMDIDLTVHYANQAGFEMFGYNRDDLKHGINAISLLHPDEIPKASERIAKHLQNIPVPALEYRMLKKDGTEFPVLWNSTPIMTEKNITGFRGTIMDLTSLKKLQDDALKAKKLESIGTLAGGIAHDFNNILMGLFGNISFAKAEVTSTHPAHDILTTAEISLDRAKHLTNQLLTFAKGGEPVKTIVTLQQLVRETTAFNLSGSNIKFELKIHPGLWPLKADKGQISQVIANLVINSRQAMPNGGTLRISLENKSISGSMENLVQAGDYILMTFCDDGTGIAPSNLEKIFDPYFTTKMQGNGLGMAIAHSIINKHDGRILVSSEIGKGTRFDIFLPALSSPEQQTGCVQPELESLPMTINAKILVMDDDEIVRDISKKMLQKLGCSVDIAYDGKEAVEKYTSALTTGKRFDAVIMDLTIPGGMGGKEAVKEVLDIDPQAIVIVASGYSTNSVMSNYRDFGFRGLVSKPYRLAELQKALEDALAD